MSDCFKQVITELHPRRNRSLQQLRKETGFVEIILFQGPSGHPISRHLALGLYHHDWVSQDAKSHLPSLRGRLLVQPILLFCFLKIYLFIYVCECSICMYNKCQKRAVDHIIDCYESSWSNWGLTSGSLEEESVLSTAKPPEQRFQWREMSTFPINLDKIYKHKQFSVS